MTEKWCGVCQRRHYYQAVEQPPAQPEGLLAPLLTVGVVIAGILSWVAWMQTQVPS
jgi:hypothetical protein